MDLQFRYRLTTELDMVSIHVQIDSERFSKVVTWAYACTAKVWNLPNATAASLIGFSLRTWDGFINEEWNAMLEQDRLRRISAFVGLCKVMHLYFSEKLTNKWGNLANTGQSFGRSKPINLMLDGGFPDTRKVSRFAPSRIGETISWEISQENIHVWSTARTLSCVELCLGIVYTS